MPVADTPLKISAFVLYFLNYCFMQVRCYNIIAEVLYLPLYPQNLNSIYHKNITQWLHDLGSKYQVYS